MRPCTVYVKFGGKQIVTANATLSTLTAFHLWARTQEIGSRQDATQEMRTHPTAHTASLHNLYNNV